MNPQPVIEGRRESTPQHAASQSGRHAGVLELHRSVPLRGVIGRHGRGRQVGYRNGIGPRDVPIAYGSGYGAFRGQPAEALGVAGKPVDRATK